MRSIRKYLIMVCAAVLPVAGLAACSQSTASAPTAIGPTTPPYTAQHPYPTWPKLTKHVHLTWWTWTTNAKNVVSAFEKQFPTISVTAVNVGSGSGEFVKLKTALEAGSGAPDVAQMQWPTLPEFVATGKVANIAPYVDQFRSYFPPSAWSLMQFGTGIYGVPEDWGTLGFAYRPAIFKQYGLVVPTTYAQFASDALKLHQENPSMYMTEFTSNSGEMMMDLLWQAGINIYQQLGPRSWKIQLDTPKAQNLMSYWAKLISEHAVLPAATYTVPDETRMAHGAYASYFLPAWGPTYLLQPAIKTGTQEFALAPLPSWQPGVLTNSSDVASLNLVTDQASDPQAAALFAAYINLAKPELQIAALPGSKGGRGLFESAKARSTVPAFNQQVPLFGNEPVNSLFSQYTNDIRFNFRWSPFTSFVDSQLGSELTKAASGKESFLEVLPHVQQAVVSFAKSEGYTITS